MCPFFPPFSNKIFYDHNRNQLEINFHRVLIEVLYQFTARQIMQNNLIGERPKSDIVFYRAFTLQGKSHKRRAVFKAILLASFLALVIINYSEYHQSYGDLLQTLLINLIASLYGLLLEIQQIVSIFSQPHIFLFLAEMRGHLVLNEFTSNYNSIENCVSQAVFAADAGLRDDDGTLLDVTKEAYLIAARASLNQELAARYPGILNSIRFHSLMSVISIIYSIIVLTTDLRTLNKTALIIYVVVVGLSEIEMIAKLILVCLVPLFCLVIMIYYCCCASRREGHINVADKGATMENILKVEGTCSICYQNVVENERIYQLPCSHIFHKGCLDNWFKIKHTCPNCRANLPVSDVAVPPLQE